ncbi:MAG TPA: Stf0 family sulfotransferase [Chthoniobacterales bacterium]|nr:Stf0 family sulfotransferase [Chthoniobacterales bacterium]
MMRALLHKLRYPQRCYVICAVPRCGSNLLSDGLTAMQKAGRPKQYFLPEFEERYGEKYGLDPAKDYAGYVRGIVRATSARNNVFGFKLMGSYLQKFLVQLRATGAFGGAGTSDLELLNEAFPRLRFVRIFRGDKLRQAISKARAMQTGVWKIAGGKQTAGHARFDAQLITRCLRDGERQEAIWSRFFTAGRLSPFTVEYETLCRAYSDTLQQVLDFLGISSVPNTATGAPTTVRQADDVSEQWYMRYRDSLANGGAWSVVTFVLQFWLDAIDLTALLPC